MRQRQQGVTLIELGIGLAIFAVLMTLSIPSFTQWMQNSQIRTAAEAMQNGLQLARATAVQRNAVISFQLMTTLGADCALSTAGPNWVVSQPIGVASAEGLCDTTPANPPTNGPAADDDPYIIQTRPMAEGSRNVQLQASESNISFNGLGRVTPAAAANYTINIINPAGGTCIADAGKMRCLRVMVSPNGQIRMCDPSVAATDVRGC